MSTLLSAAKILFAVLGAAVVLFVVYVAWLILGTFGVVWSPFNCLTAVYHEISDVPGYKFLIDGETCAGIGKGPTEISVFALKDGRKGRVLLFKYVRWHDDFGEPGIRSIDDRTIEISVEHVASVICLTRRWESLSVKYDIDVLTDWRGNPARECAGD